MAEEQMSPERGEKRKRRPISQNKTYYFKKNYNRNFDERDEQNSDTSTSKAEFERALNIHGIDDGSDDSSSSGASSFDEEYFRHKPPPMKIDPSNVIVVEKEDHKTQANKMYSEITAPKKVTNNERKFTAGNSSGASNLNEEYYRHKPPSMKIDPSNVIVVEREDHKTRENELYSEITATKRVTNNERKFTASNSRISKKTPQKENTEIFMNLDETFKVDKNINERRNRQKATKEQTQTISTSSDAREMNIPDVVSEKKSSPKYLNESLSSNLGHEIGKQNSQIETRKINNLDKSNESFHQTFSNSVPVSSKNSQGKTNKSGQKVPASQTGKRHRAQEKNETEIRQSRVVPKHSERSLPDTEGRDVVSHRSGRQAVSSTRDSIPVSSHKSKLEGKENKKKLNNIVEKSLGIQAQNVTVVRVSDSTEYFGEKKVVGQSIASHVNESSFSSKNSGLNSNSQRSRSGRSTETQWNSSSNYSTSISSMPYTNHGTQTQTERHIVKSPQQNIPSIREVIIQPQNLVDDQSLRSVRDEDVNLLGERRGFCSSFSFRCLLRFFCCPSFR